MNYAASYAHARGAFSGPPPPEKFPRRLLFSGWAITLLYFPSGLLHAWLGSGVYFRDGLLFLHLIASITYLIRKQEWRAFARTHWFLVVPACFIFPAFLDAGSRVEALTFVKWTALWLDWLVLGRLAQLERGLTRPSIILAVLTVGLLLADVVAGGYEHVTHTFIFPGMESQVTAFGVGLGKEEMLGLQLRVKGLQRDVFSYANLMGMGTVLGLLGLVESKTARRRVIALVCTGLFAWSLLISGGRSAFFGVFVCILVVISLLFAPEMTRRFYPRIVLGWLLIALTISAFGVGQLTELVGGAVLSHSEVGSSTSAYMRDTNWAGIMEAIRSVPVVLMFGSPFGSLVDSKVEIFYHWADNEYLWLMYHTSVIGLAALIWYFRGATIDRRDQERAWLRDVIIFFLLFVMGEAIARESLTFIGGMPLFVAMGWYEAGRGGEHAPPPPERRRRRPAASSVASDFSRRIAAKAKGRA